MGIQCPNNGGGTGQPATSTWIHAVIIAEVPVRPEPACWRGAAAAAASGLAGAGAALAWPDEGVFNPCLAPDTDRWLAHPLVREALGEDPLSGHLWVFHSRDRRAVKLLLWDTGGFLLIHKRLEKGRFRLPRSDGKTVRMTAAELTALLEGIDLSTARRLPRWNPVEETVVSGKGRVIPVSP